MFDYSRVLGDLGKQARGKLDMTQKEVADAIGIDDRTVLNIENYKGNPKLQVLFPLFRLLKIDSRELFNPEMTREDPAIQRLRLFVEDCSSEEAELLLPIMLSSMNAIRKINSK